MKDFTSEPTDRLVLEDDPAIVLGQIPPFLWLKSLHFSGLKLGLGVGDHGDEAEHHHAHFSDLTGEAAESGFPMKS